MRQKKWVPGGISKIRIIHSSLIMVLLFCFSRLDSNDLIFICNTMDFMVSNPSLSSVPILPIRSDMLNEIIGRKWFYERTSFKKPTSIPSTWNEMHQLQQIALCEVPNHLPPLGIWPKLDLVVLLAIQELPTVNLWHFPT